MRFRSARVSVKANNDARLISSIGGALVGRARGAFGSGSPMGSVRTTQPPLRNKCRGLEKFLSLRCQVRYAAAVALAAAAENGSPLSHGSSPELNTMCFFYWHSYFRHVLSIVHVCVLLIHHLAHCQLPHSPLCSMRCLLALTCAQIHFLLLFNRQGKIRLTKYYDTYTQKERGKLEKEITHLVLGRREKLSNFLDWKEQKLVYKRCASSPIIRSFAFLLLTLFPLSLSLQLRFAVLCCCR